MSPGFRRNGLLQPPAPPLTPAARRSICSQAANGNGDEQEVQSQSSKRKTGMVLSVVAAMMAIAALVWGYREMNGSRWLENGNVRGGVALAIWQRSGLPATQLAISEHVRCFAAGVEM